MFKSTPLRLSEVKHFFHNLKSITYIINATVISPRKKLSPTYRNLKYTDIDNLIIKLSGGGVGNRGIADFLNVNGIKTVRGRVFTATLIGMKKREIRERMWILNHPDTIVIEDETIYYKN